MVRKLVPFLAAGLLVAGCGSPAGTAVPTGSSATSGAPATVATPSATPGPTAVVTTRLDETLTLADGRKIKARCVGEGSPTILLEVGGSNDMSDWAPQFYNELGATTTTCLYSRAGGPGSDPPANPPVSMEAVTSDAFEVLELAEEKAGVEGPYVFVGWSLGGSVALANGLTRPDQTVGLAIVDTDFPIDFFAVCPTTGLSEEECQAIYEEDIDAKFMESEIAKAVQPLDVPAVLVTAMDYPDCIDSPEATLSVISGGVMVVAGDCAGLATAVADKQVADWAAALPEIVQTRLDANHNGMISSDGRQIAALILEIVEAARASL
jgi:pimeloyl-ACP methyl ester carboxylesterase